MLIVIPYHKNTIGLTAILCQLQPQLKSTDVLYVVDTSGLPAKDPKSGFYLTNLYTAGKHTTLVEMGRYSVYESWNIGIEFFQKHPSEGVLFLNDDIVISGTLIQNLKRAVKIGNYEAYVPRCSDKNYITHSISHQFKWFSQTLTSGMQLTPTNWLVGCSFLLTPEAIAKKGLFSTKYKVWYGDDEYQKDLSIGQLEVEYVHHFVGRSYDYTDPQVRAGIFLDKSTFEKQS